MLLKESPDMYRVELVAQPLKVPPGVYKLGGEGFPNQSGVSGIHQTNIDSDLAMWVQGSTQR